jgi:hypothetical protein
MKTQEISPGKMKNKEGQKTKGAEDIPCYHEYRSIGHQQTVGDKLVYS